MHNLSSHHIDYRIIPRDMTTRYDTTLQDVKWLTRDVAWRAVTLRHLTLIRYLT